MQKILRHLKNNTAHFNLVTPIKQININDRIQNYLKPLALKMLKVVRPVPVCKIPTSLDECEIILSQLFRSTNSIIFFVRQQKTQQVFGRPNSLCRKCGTHTTGTHNFYQERLVGQILGFLLGNKKKLYNSQERQTERKLTSATSRLFDYEIQKDTRLSRLLILRD